MLFRPRRPDGVIDRATFARTVRESAPRLLRLAARILGDAAEAEDVVQECYVRAWRALSDGKFEGQAELGTWLHRIVCNATLDALRARKRRDRRATGAGRPESFDAGPQLDARMALRELHGLLGALPPDQRVALVLKEMEGMSTEEIARLTGASIGAVEQRLVRARATLRAATAIAGATGKERT